jgi:very-short-patch-repair endonuclease
VVASGGDRHVALRRVKAGRWDSPYEEVYRIAGVPWTYEAEVLALILAAGDGACASHRCACRLLGIGFKTAKPEISITRGTFFRPKGLTVHTSTDLDRCEIVTRNGIPVTEAARALLDTSRYAHGVALRNLVEAARRLDLVDWHDLIECVSRHARQGRRGINDMRRVIAAGATSDEITETDGELAAVGLLREHGLGEPRLQYKLYADDGRLVANMDTAFPEDRVNIEIDGPVHQREEVRLRDEARDQEVRAVYGWTVRRVYKDIPVLNPPLFLNIVRTTFKEAREKAAGRNLLV